MRIMTPSVTEIQLTERLIKGNMAAFDALYHQYHHTVFANILHYVQRPEIAEDILQEVFMALWTHRQSLQNTVGSWLFIVSHNKSLSYLKKALSEKKMLASLPVEITDLELDETTYQVKVNILNEAINRLPPAKKQAFQLCKLEGRSYQEAALLLNTSPEVIKERLKSGSRLIRSYIADHPTTSQLTTVLIFLAC